MIIFTVTNTRKKRGLLLKLGLVMVMVAFLLPYLHGLMLEVSAMEELQAPVEQQIPPQQETPDEQQAAAIVGQDAAGIYEEDFPGEPVRVNGELWLPLAHLQEVATLLSY